MKTVKNRWTHAKIQLAAVVATEPDDAVTVLKELAALLLQLPEVASGLWVEGVVD